MRWRRQSMLLFFHLQCWPNRSSTGIYSGGLLSETKKEKKTKKKNKPSPLKISRIGQGNEWMTRLGSRLKILGLSQPSHFTASGRPRSILLACLLVPVAPQLLSDGNGGSEGKKKEKKKKRKMKWSHTYAQWRGRRLPSVSAFTTRPCRRRCRGGAGASRRRRRRSSRRACRS